MKVRMEFNWCGQQIVEFVESARLYNDVLGKDDFWGSFILKGVEYQYQIHWESSILTIFLKGGVEIIDRVTNFNLAFSNNLK